MTVAYNANFRWERLIVRIMDKEVIPVIGQGLYRVDIESEGKKNCLLYDYLAGCMLERCGATLHPEENHKFAKACFEFLKKNQNDYRVLSHFLKEKLEGIQLTPDSSLRKLSMIKYFNMFITTAYDSFLADTINEVRNSSPTVLHYAVREKDMDRIDKELLKLKENSNFTLGYHILGNLKECMEPAYTEKDILETVLAFQRDMENKPKNRLSRKLEGSSLLFLGCGYDDWLFRFFIRTFANKPYKCIPINQTCNFVGDDFYNNKRDPFQELPQFLQENEAEIFYSNDGSDFVDMLFKKVEESDPEGIISTPITISPQDSPGIAFISFEGGDRPAARRLAENLRKDGITVWLDESQFKGGDEVDQTILNAIDECPVFIPLISTNSQQIQTPDGKLKYHLQEWQHAYSNKKSGKQDITIIPVKIEDIKWNYDKFSSFYYFNIPGGGKGGNYKKLRDQLREIQKKTRMNNGHK